MKQKILTFLLVATIIILPENVLAFNNENEMQEQIIVAETVKYYKTVTYNNYNQLYYSTQSLNLANSYTTEITKEEYDNSNIVNSVLGEGLSETTYKKLTSSIIQNGSQYQYKAVLNWKNFPSSRSYDIIGIGYYPSVKINSTPSFSLYTCFSNGSCTTTTTHYPQTFNSGVGTSFKLPTGSLTTLRATLYFNVTKNTTATVINQIAAADYAHATSTVTANQSKNYTVNANGISLGGSISSYYDAMGSAVATWSGSW